MLPNKSQAGSNLTSFDVLKTRLFDLSYKKITASEENSRLLDDTVLISKPVMEPSRRIKPEIIHLVREERLRHLVEGAEFPAFPKTGRKVCNQFFYCCLSPNHKMLHFGDCSGGTQPPPIESLDKKIQVSEMWLETGANCPHASTSRRVNTRYIYASYITLSHASFCCRSWYKTSLIPRPPFNTGGGSGIKTRYKT